MMSKKITGWVSNPVGFFDSVTPITKTKIIIQKFSVYIPYHINILLSLSPGLSVQNHHYYLNIPGQNHLA